MSDEKQDCPESSPHKRNPEDDAVRPCEQDAILNNHFLQCLCPCMVPAYSGPNLLFEEVQQEMQTGDVLIFRRRKCQGGCHTCGWMATCCLELNIGHTFSHTGFIVRGTSGVYLAHAVFPKVQIRELKYVIDSGHYSDIVYRKLKTPFPAETEKAINKWAYANEEKNIKYEVNLCTYARARMDCCDDCENWCGKLTRNEARADPADIQKLFCSQYVAVMLQMHKKISTETDSSEYLPQEFLGQAFDDILLPIQHIDVDITRSTIPPSMRKPDFKDGDRSALTSLKQAPPDPRSTSV